MITPALYEPSMWLFIIMVVGFSFLLVFASSLRQILKVPISPFYRTNWTNPFNQLRGKTQTLNFLRIRRTLWKLRMYTTKDTKPIVES